MTPATSSALPPGIRLIAACIVAGAPLCSVHADERPSSPTGGGDSITLEPVPAAAPVRIQRPVFVCRDAESVTFADRPCGPVVEARALDVAEPGPGRVASTARQPPTAATKPRIQPAERVTRPAPIERRCGRLRDQLDALDDRMRAGYSAREAARLWNRWREVKAELRDARC